MEHRIGRTIRVILRSIGSGVHKLIVRMKTGNLNGAPQTQIVDSSFPSVKEVIVVQEVAENARVDEQRRFDMLDRGGGKGHEFASQIEEQCLLLVGVGDD